MSEFETASTGAKMDFAEDMSYGDYLRLDPILDAQHPLSTAHDEMLFIVQHQTSELWMRLAIHELEAARDAMLNGDLPPAFKMLSRVARIFEQLNSAWDVLRTMTPSEYTAFRPSLGNSSGFQSHQYRLIEYILGNRVSALMQLHKHRPEAYARLRAELEQPSLYQVAIGLLCARFDHARIGSFMNWRKNWSISKTISAAGVSITSLPSNGSSGSSAALAVRQVSRICARCWT